MPVLPVREEWRRTIYGSAIGQSGVHVADLNADGGAQIVAAAASSGGWYGTFWYVVEWDGTSYQQVWASDEYPDFITSITVAQVDSDPALEVLVGVGGDVLVYDGATRELQSAFPSPAARVIGLTVADVDGDGQVEAVFCDSPTYTDTLYVYGIASGVQEFAGAGYGCSDLAIANVDGDPGLEIVIARGTDTGYVLDGATRAVKWANAWGFGSLVELADVDGDGRSEALAAFPWDGIWIFDVELQSLATILDADDITTLDVLDADGDGLLEIVYGTAFTDTVYVHDALTLALEWQVTADVWPAWGVGGLAFGDLDGDGCRTQHGRTAVRAHPVSSSWTRPRGSSSGEARTSRDRSWPSPTAMWMPTETRSCSMAATLPEGSSPRASGSSTTRQARSWSSAAS